MVDIVTRPTEPSARTIGLAHIGHPAVLGSLIGGIGASAFVLINRGTLPGSWPMVLLVLWAALAAATAWAVLLRRRHLVDPGPPAANAGLVYGLSIVGMIAGMAAGRAVLSAIDRPEVQPAVVVLAVGLHFVPFAQAFRAPIFGVLGWSVTALGILGVVGGLLGGAVPAAAVATATGLVMLLAILSTTRDASRSAR